MLMLKTLVIAALQAASTAEHAVRCPSNPANIGPPYEAKDCTCHVGKARFALSLYTQSGHLYGPTPDEFNKVIGGTNWVLDRRTPRIVERYGADVICVSQKQYDAAECDALAARAAKMRVAPFGLLCDARRPKRRHKGGCTP